MAMSSKTCLNDGGAIAWLGCVLLGVLWLLVCLSEREGEAEHMVAISGAAAGVASMHQCDDPLAVRWIEQGIS